MARYRDKKVSNYGGIAFYMQPFKYRTKDGKSGTMWKGKSKNGALTVTMTQIQSEFGEFRVELFGLGSVIKGAKSGSYKAGMRKASQSVYGPMPQNQGVPDWLLR